jgi:hypothetical protein
MKSRERKRCRYVGSIDLFVTHSAEAHLFDVTACYRSAKKELDGRLFSPSDPIRHASLRDLASRRVVPFRAGLGTLGWKEEIHWMTQA